MSEQIIIIRKTEYSGSKITKIVSDAKAAHTISQICNNTTFSWHEGCNISIYESKKHVWGFEVSASHQKIKHYGQEKWEDAHVSVHDVTESFYKAIFEGEKETSGQETEKLFHKYECAERDLQAIREMSDISCRLTKKLEELKRRKSKDLQEIVGACYEHIVGEENE